MIPKHKNIKFLFEKDLQTGIEDWIFVKPENELESLKVRFEELSKQNNENKIYFIKQNNNQNDNY